MQIVQSLAGFTLGRSDLLRRAMSKKKLSVMESERQAFVYGNEKKNSWTSVRQKLKHFRDVVSKDQNKERSREKNKDRGQSL